jgi:hypothetical protein
MHGILISKVRMYIRSTSTKYPAMPRLLKLRLLFRARAGCVLGCYPNGRRYYGRSRWLFWNFFMRREMGKAK